MDALMTAPERAAIKGGAYEEDLKKDICFAYGDMFSTFYMQRSGLCVGMLFPNLRM